MVTLYEYILDSLPPNALPILRQSIDAFSSLPGLSDWRPDDLYLGSIGYIVNNGLLFHLLRDANGCHFYTTKQRFADSVISRHWMGQADMAELHAGAILCHLGSKITYPGTSSGTRTADIHGIYNGSQFDAEVTSALMKEAHKQAHDTIRVLAESITDHHQQFHIVIYSKEPPSNEECMEILNAIVTLVAGSHIEKPESWLVHALPLEKRDLAIGGENSEILKPKWWPNDEPSFFVNSTFISSSAIPPVVRMVCGIPVLSYMNPIQRKADRSQRRSGTPYLIVMDASQLPGAHGRISKELYDALTMWDHVSAIILISNRFYCGVEKKCWEISVFINEAATHKLPPGLLSEIGPRHQICINLVHL